MIRETLLYLGIEVKLLFASFCGGIVSVFFNKASTALVALGLIITGTFTGHWFGPYAAKLIGMSDAPAAAGFLVGVMSMSVLKWATDKAKAKMGDPVVTPTTTTDGGTPNVG